MTPFMARMITGGCLCGAVRYAAAATAFHETVCHCADCRRAVGAHTVGWFSVRRSALALTGEPARFRSSAGATRSFCGRCGTSLLFESDAHPEEVDVTLGSLDDPNALPPRDHTWTASKLDWDTVCDGLPAFAQGRSGGAIRRGDPDGRAVRAPSHDAARRSRSAVRSRPMSGSRSRSSGP